MGGGRWEVRWEVGGGEGRGAGPRRLLLLPSVPLAGSVPRSERNRLGLRAARRQTGSYLALEKEKNRDEEMEGERWRWRGRGKEEKVIEE